ncbi:HipA domain-containing protein [Roseomonas sp. GCM10028921]
MEELLEAASRVEKGIALTPALELALHHGTSIGGARPKALVVDGGKRLIVKFSAQNDIYSVVKGEFLLMRLARHVGLDVAPVRLARSAGKDVLL